MMVPLAFPRPIVDDTFEDFAKRLGHFDRRLCRCLEEQAPRACLNSIAFPSAVSKCEHSAAMWERGGGGKIRSAGVCARMGR
jgi:hypothetical protein